MSLYCVYVHTNKVNGKRYVGITSQNVARRWRNGNGYYENEHFYAAIQKYGWDNFTHEIIKAGLTKDEACALERSTIAKYNSDDWRHGYNKSSGGERPAQGVRHSEETKRKMSEAHKGIVFSEERKHNMSEAAKKRGNNRGGMTGAACPKAGILEQIDKATGELVATFYGYAEMQRATGYEPTPVHRVVKGTQRQAYGYVWKYTPRRHGDVVIL